MKKRVALISARVSAIGFGIGIALWIVPAPLWGYWHTPLSDCLCDSKNLIAFENGKVYRWASGHGQVKESFGIYGAGIYWREWDTGKGRVSIRPGWFWMRIRMPKDAHYPGGRTYWGFRELRPSYIKEVLNTKKSEPKPAAGNARSVLHYNRKPVAWGG